jgi:ESCRT-II complex subunit VPS25
MATQRRQQRQQHDNDGDYAYPDFYNFPPFFTIQPVLATREKQFALWRELILKYTATKKIKVLSIHDKELWVNKKITRQLSTDSIVQICNDFILHGHGEWLDTTNDRNKQTSMRIFWKQPEQIASDIYVWAEQNRYINSIVTVYELHSGDDTNDSSFHNIDEDILRRALAILEQQGKCTIFQGDTSEEDGIKFS